ncbi:hypothetical protein NC653_040591 [Populus alba x Populus x berolinensis]|uniref:Uncharacterized protein n=1 Tax=Populus alba x Populus x berolinensis TaxID=444605 RepID=A0AAD6L8U7_9ROSI|nr:hypothetical protein NC653_040591 [Populus alba x Populus x berolinensis]
MVRLKKRKQEKKVEYTFQASKNDVFLSCDIVLMYEKHAATFVWSARRCNDSARISVSLCLSVDCNLLHGLNYHCVNHHFVHLSSKNDSYFSLMKQLVGLNSALHLPIDLVSSLREMRCNLRVKERSMISEC